MDAITATLILLLVTSNAFWAWQTHKMINKLMARSLHEYLDASKPQKARPQNLDLAQNELLDHNLGSVTEIL
jgi:hypothetical protein